MGKIVFYTLGCRANQYQTDGLKAGLLGADDELVRFGEPADLYVINTCAVTGDADRRSRQTIRRALQLAPRVMVSGCLSQLWYEALKSEFPTVEIVRTATLPGLQKAVKPQVRANLMVQDGCDHYCSYCVVPLARGRSVSKPPDEVLREARILVAAGARELVLTGINLGTYRPGLPELCKRLSAIDGLLRLRLSSLEPMYLQNELVEAIAANPRVCRHLHIPLQSGDDNILKAMNRHYTGEHFAALVAAVRRAIPDCGLSTDIIVGFPGEGDQEFTNTLRLVERLKFSRLHVFSYSRRDGTPAANFVGQVDPAAKKQRNRQLRALGEALFQTYCQQFLGKKVEVLVERPGVGLTDNYIRVVFPKTSAEIGTLQSMVIKEIKKDRCVGTF